jgi:hypothetical protein
MKSIVQVVTLRKLHHLGPSETTDSQNYPNSTSFEQANRACSNNGHKWHATSNPVLRLDPLGHQTGQITPESMLHEFNHHTKHIDPSDRIEEMCTLAGAQQWLIMGHTIQGGAELERCNRGCDRALFRTVQILFHTVPWKKKLKFFWVCPHPQSST